MCTRLAVASHDEIRGDEDAFFAPVLEALNSANRPGRCPCWDCGSRIAKANILTTGPYSGVGVLRLLKRRSGVVARLGREARAATAIVLDLRRAGRRHPRPRIGARGARAEE